MADPQQTEPIVDPRSRAHPVLPLAPGICAFVGAARSGPVDVASAVITNTSEFERLYGGADDMEAAGQDTLRPNYLANAVSGFFLNGGSRLHVVRVCGQGSRAASAAGTPIVAAPDTGRPQAWFAVRHPGAALDGAVVEVTLKSDPATRDMLDIAADGTIARIASHDYNRVGLWYKRRSRWIEGAIERATTARTADEPTADEPTADERSAREPAGAESSAIDPVADFDRLQLHAELLSVDVVAMLGERTVLRLGELSVIPGHPRYIGYAMALAPTRQSMPVDSPIVIEFDSDGTIDPDRLLVGLVGDGATLAGAPAQRRFVLSGGSDGAVPGVADYARGLSIAAQIAAVSIVAVPGYSAHYHDSGPSVCEAIARLLVAHAEEPQSHRFAVLEVPPGLPPHAAALTTQSIAANNAAFYYPWLVLRSRIADRRAAAPASLPLYPPTGLVCGMLAREDAAHAPLAGVGESVVLAVDRLEFEPDAAALAALADARINCLRRIDAGAVRIHRAVTASLDERWRDEALRRYFLSLSGAISLGLAWTAFERDDDKLWSAVRSAIEDFLFNEWARGTLVGARPEEAFFVRCGRDTMTDNDIGAGRLIAIVGIAPLRPGEFMQWQVESPALPG